MPSLPPRGGDRALGDTGGLKVFAGADKSHFYTAREEK